MNAPQGAKEIDSFMSSPVKNLLLAMGRPWCEAYLPIFSHVTEKCPNLVERKVAVP